MGNTIKLVSGFILFVIGVLIAYEASVYNLLDILLIIGLIIAIVGIIMMISHFVESNADRTTNKIKEFLESKESNSSFERKNFTGEGPLKIRHDYNDFDDAEYDDLVIEDYNDSTPSEYYGDSFEDNPNRLLRTVPRQEKELNLDNQLVFTPNYGRPLKVTRTPKKRQSDYFEKEMPPFVVETDKSDEIKRALEEPTPVEKAVNNHTLAPEVKQPRDIKIDINDPESLPVPKSLSSHILCNDSVITSQEAFDQLAIYVNKEIMLEIPSLNELSDRFLSHVPTSYSRVIIDEFDTSDMSYMFLISSLLKQGVHIKTVPKVHTVNLITDDSHAMIISEGQNDMEYGAIYDDRKSISNIRASFEKTWNIASNLDENIIMGSVGGSA
ncbi:hypothetical protein SAMN05216439_0236 [Methanobrevibacter gottschalkii]|uniref:Uncharacterized protein n=1 Tax=Methanobrevibacter gottschalkii TaxID=190974 RepID=A0A1H7NQA6_9EURY|nr:hypothetical protein [Methanobrevibacter gottschalkii]MCQ2970710.1 hypothetical protein [archaeon]SEL25218.1 hypothetical protein SAMN05216439_0236 [Methanobrevibacter gottschalkii]